MFLSWIGPRSVTGRSSRPFDLPVGLFGKTDGPRLRDALEPGGDIDAVAHQVAVAFLDNIAQVNAHPELDAALGRKSGIAFDEGGLHLDGAAHRPRCGTPAIPSSLDDAPMMGVDGRIDQIAAQPPQPRQCAILIRPREPAVADDIRDQNRRDFTRFPHGAPSGRHLE